MDFKAIQEALVTMGRAMIGVMERMEEQTKIQEQILEELKKINENR